MTTEESLLAAVLAAPDDDLPRLVYADYLDERSGPGDAERAEFIRVQCELGRLIPATCNCTDAGHGVLDCEICDRRIYLRNRERELWAGIVSLSIDSGGVLWGLPVERCTVPGVNAPRLYPSETHIVRRGFVSEIACTLAEWRGGECPQCGGTGLIGLSRAACPGCIGINPVPGYGGTGRTTGIGPAVVRRHPVERVSLTDAVETVSEGHGRVTYDTAGPLVRVAFPMALNGQVEGPIEWLTTRISDAAILWAKS